MKNKSEKIRTPLILYLGSKGFPFGSATIQRQINISKALVMAGFHVIVLSRRSGHSKKIAIRENIRNHDFHKGIEYYYTSILPYKSNNFIIRNINRLIGNINEFFYIGYNKIFRNAEFIIVHANNLQILKYYYFISRLFSLELIYDYVELYDAMGKRDIYNRDNIEFNFDYKFHNYVDKIILISTYLGDHVKELDSSKKTIKVPPIIDFDSFDIEFENKEGRSYLLFCGNVGYTDVVNFIIEAYERSEARHKDVKLELVLNGNQFQIEQLRNYIQKMNLEEFILIDSNLPYSVLIERYKNALALLIPILNNIQDQARVPFKICEYTASRRPIITTETETTLEYFENGNDAILCKFNSVDDYVKNLNFVCNNRKKMDEIGINGYSKGKEIFNYKNYAESLKDFLNA